jgi:hypothetical protein
MHNPVFFFFFYFPRFADEYTIRVFLFAMFL